MVDARRSLSKQSVATITFGGSCEVQATTRFDLTTRFGGIGRVHGVPLTIAHNKTLGGSLLFQNLGDKDE
jgi:hypothetical protein